METNRLRRRIIGACTDSFLLQVGLVLVGGFPRQVSQFCPWVGQRVKGLLYYCQLLRMPFTLGYRP